MCELFCISLKKKRELICVATKLQRKWVLLFSEGTWKSHVTHTNESCHTYERVMSHESRHRYEWAVCVTRRSYRCGRTHLCVSHKSCHMCRVTPTNESCRTYECVMPHIWMSHVTHMNASCHTYEWVVSPNMSVRCMLLNFAGTWTSHVTHMNESCRTYAWVMLHI